MKILWILLECMKDEKFMNFCQEVHKDENLTRIFIEGQMGMKICKFLLRGM